LAIAAANPAAVFAFDLLSLKGKDLRVLPLLKRKAADESF
jgi:ATP-dependent DNA ligase